MGFFCKVHCNVSMTRYGAGAWLYTYILHWDGVRREIARLVRGNGETIPGPIHIKVGRVQWVDLQSGVEAAIGRARLAERRLHNGVVLLLELEDEIVSRVRVLQFGGQLKVGHRRVDRARTT